MIPPPPAPAAGRPGTTIGSIHLLRRIGRGGMSTVHVGFDVEAGRLVAVKVLFPEVAAERKARARFEQEGRIYQTLNHPNIARYVDSGVTPDGAPFLALEFVNGTSLHTLLEQSGRLPPADVLEFLEDLTKSLDHAHAKGVIHRDIKPQNLILNQDGFLKVVDFGIAQVRGTHGVTTATGQVLATYSYAPPEQNQGKEIDRTADLYAMGALAWEMLVGRRFVTGTSPPQIVLQQTMGPPPPPSAHVPGLPPGFDVVTRRLCMPYPEDRYQSAQEVWQALREIRRGISGEAEILAYYGDEVHEKWNLAKNAFHNGQLSLANSLAKYIVRTRAGFAPAQFLLGKLYAARDLPFNATEAFRRAIELRPDNEAYALEFAITLYRMGRLDEARVELARVLGEVPDAPLPAALLAVIESRLDAGRRAELDRAAADDPPEAPLWLGDGPRPIAGAAAAREIPAAALPPPPPDRPVPTFPQVDVDRAAEISGFLPGLAHLQLGAVREARRMFAASAGLVAGAAGLALWRPASPGGTALWFAGGGFLAWAAYSLWRSAKADARRRAVRLHLRGGVARVRPDGGVEINIGRDRGVVPGQVYELARDGLALGTTVIEAVEDHLARGRFEASPVSDLPPAPGDTARFLRDSATPRPSVGARATRPAGPALPELDPEF